MFNKIGWGLSVAISLALLGSIVYTMNAKLNSYKPNEAQLTDNNAVNSYLDKHFNKTRKIGQNPPIRIPTGVFVQSFDFQGVNDVKVTGYLWQIYNEGLHERVGKGVIFPDAVDQTSDAVALSYKKAVCIPKKGNNSFALENEENLKNSANATEKFDEPNFSISCDPKTEEKSFVYGYYFEVTLRQNFEFREYPFDVQEIWLRLWHSDFAENVVLVPALSSYRDTSVGVNFGTDSQMVLGEWELMETYFTYKSFKYDTDFGLTDKESAFIEEWPELHFNMAIKRQFHNAMFSHIIPLFIMALLSFFTLILLTRNKELLTKWELSTSGVLNLCGVLVFLVIIGHIDLRKTIAGDSVVYLEAYYLGSYFIIAGVFLASYLFSLSSKKRLSHYYLNNAALAKMMFWPSVFLMVSILNYIYLA